MSSNNPFAKVLNEDYVHHRDPPPVPNNAPSRPPKSALPPPSYEEAAGKEGKKEYPREKSSSNSRSERPERPERSDRPDRHRSERDRSERDRSERGERRTHRSHSDSRSDRHKSSHRSRSDKDKDKRKSKKPEPAKSKNLDTIDKLDVTAFFGSGFHHDGPFDACAPHRNKNVKAAPVMAFPVDGPNNSIKGVANIDKDEQMNLAFGNYNDQNEIIGRKISIKKKLTSKSSDDLPYQPKIVKSNGYDYNNNGNEEHSSLYLPKQNPSVINFDANMKSEPVHGPATAGLGSSTFLDGAPAPKQDDYLSTNNGLGRKKSLVQRLRKNSGNELLTRNSNDYLESSNTSSFEESGNSLIRRVKSLKVGRRER